MQGLQYYFPRSGRDASLRGFRFILSSKVMYLMKSVLRGVLSFCVKQRIDMECRQNTVLLRYLDPTAAPWVLQLEFGWLDLDTNSSLYVFFSREQLYAVWCSDTRAFESFLSTPVQTR